jgi:catechol 2,3-dioxygenase-like lactoylglutathione lyase family enzyme
MAAANSSASSSSSSSLLATRLSSIGLHTPAARWAALGLSAAAAAVVWFWHRRARAASIRSCRPLHWVFKVGDLERTVDFYSTIFGLKVQRHEEFDHGCEATCNGPYAGWWSKTMMSHSTEENFSIELTYNYGISTYARGNDLAGIHVAIPGAVQRAREKGVEVHATDDPRVFKIQNPDGQWWFIHEDHTTDFNVDPFLYISLNTSDLKSATGESRIWPER